MFKGPKATCALLGALVLLLGGRPAGAEDPRLEAFVDGFEGFDPGRWYLSDGWSNGDWQNCTWSKAAVAVAGGALRLSFLPQLDGSFLCGEVQTRGVAGFGTFGMRGRVTRPQSGLNAAFFTYIGPVHGQPHDEIDVEILTRDPGTVSFNTYTAGQPAHGAVTPLVPPADAAWHDFAFRWRPDGIAWFVDGREVHRTPPGALSETLPAHHQKIYLSLWGSGTLTEWMGPFAPPAEAVALEVDCVWYTPGEGDGDDAGTGPGPTTAQAAGCP